MGASCAQLATIAVSRNNLADGDFVAALHHASCDARGVDAWITRTWHCLRRFPVAKFISRNTVSRKTVGIDVAGEQTQRERALSYNSIVKRPIHLGYMPV